MDFVLQQFVDANSNRVSIRIWRTMYMTLIDEAGIPRERGALMAITPNNQTIDCMAADLEWSVLPLPYNRSALLRRYRSGKSQIAFQMLLEKRRLPFRLVAGFDKSIAVDGAVRPVLAADIAAGPGLLDILNGPADQKTAVSSSSSSSAASSSAVSSSSAASSSASSAASSSITATPTASEPVIRPYDDRHRASSWPGWQTDRVEFGTTTIAALLLNDNDGETKVQSWSNWNTAFQPEPAKPSAAAVEVDIQAAAAVAEASRFGAYAASTVAGYSQNAAAAAATAASVSVPDAAGITETYERLASIGAIVKPDQDKQDDPYTQFGS
jgi:hypothetical protein